MGTPDHAGALRDVAKELHAAEDQLEGLRTQRNMLVEIRLREGATVREVAEEARMSHAAVARIGQRVFGVRQRGRRPAESDH